MTYIPFGRVVTLTTKRSSRRREFRIGLEAVAKSTGKLKYDPDVKYDGDGISFRPGDVLFGKLRPNLRKAWLADTHGDAVGDFHVYRPVSALMSSRYLAYLVLSEPFLEPVIASVYGAKMPRADWSDVRRVTVWVPDIRAQNAIADYLDRETAQIDAFIAKNEELIALLTERRASAIVDVIGRHETNPLKRLVSTKRPLTYGILQCGEPVDDGVPYIGPADLPGEGTSPALSALRRTTPEIAAVYGRSVLAGGDIVVSIGPAFGRVGLLADDLAGANLTQDTVRVASLPNKVLPEYLVWVLSSRIAHDYWDYEILGATFRRLNLGTLAETPIPLPSVPEQALIVDRLTTTVARIDQAAGVARRCVDLARERRAALISAAVTGKIEVEVAA